MKRLIVRRLTGASLLLGGWFIGFMAWGFHRAHFRASITSESRNLSDSP